MKYLLYYWAERVRKFPLAKTGMRAGRDRENDLSFNYEYLDDFHLEITVKKDFITITDLNSTFGTLVDDKPLHQADIHVGQSFFIGGVEFFLKEGAPGPLEEFSPARELLPYFDRIKQENENRMIKNRDQGKIDIYGESLKKILHSGMKSDNINYFFLELPNYLGAVPPAVSVVVLAWEDGKITVLVSHNTDSARMDLLKQAVPEYEITGEPAVCRCSPVNGKQYYLYIYPCELPGQKGGLFFISPYSPAEMDDNMRRFFMGLSWSICLVSRLFASAAVTPASAPRACDFPVEIIAGSEKMHDLLQQCKKIAESSIFVLIEGESGTGKELFARYIHKHSHRCAQVYIALNCAAIPENLLESELFGYEKGAFTDASAQKKGKLEIASGGTLVLDEVGDMPLSLQAKLLRVLQEGEFYRLGGTTPIKVDLRVIAITNKNLKQLVKDEKFRQDLYYRLVHRSIVIPPLRERKEDISPLLNYFTGKFCKINRKIIKGCTLEAFEALHRYDWPGNVRQLENEIKSVVSLAPSGKSIDLDMLSCDVRSGCVEFDTVDQVVHGKPRTGVTPVNRKEWEVNKILEVLEKNNWNKTRAAKELNMTYRGLHKKMKRLGIEQ
jgi:DNA-binding NtrC family response regulator